MRAGVGRVESRPTGGKKRRQHVRSLSVAPSLRSPPLELKLAREVWTCIHLLRHRKSFACKTCRCRPAEALLLLECRHCRLADWLAGVGGLPTPLTPAFKSD